MWISVYTSISFQVNMQHAVQKKKKSIDNIY